MLRSKIRKEVKNSLQEEPNTTLFKRALIYYIRSLEVAKAKNDETYTIMITPQEEQELAELLSGDIKDVIEYFLISYHKRALKRMKENQKK